MMKQKDNKITNINNYYSENIDKVVNKTVLVLKDMKTSYSIVELRIY